MKYGIAPEKVQSIATFSPQYLSFAQAVLPAPVEKFLLEHPRVILSYVSLRPEYRLEVLQEGMKRYRKTDPAAGLSARFPGKEMPAAEQFVATWPAEERNSLLCSAIWVTTSFSAC